ncbi:MAG: hypothetical protein AAF714_11840 [Pseudomonadota bacterium]
MTRLRDGIVPRHKSASRALGFALTAVDASSWESASLLWRARLSPAERASHAVAALAACQAEDAQQILGSYATEAGPPVVPLFDLMGEAFGWASVASVLERKAYSLAAFHSLTGAEQAAFLAKVAEDQAA